MHHLCLFPFHFAALGVFVPEFFGLLKDTGFLDMSFMLVYRDGSPSFFTLGALI